MAINKILALTLLASLSLTVSGCSATAEKDIENTITIEGEEPSETANPGTENSSGNETLPNSEATSPGAQPTPTQEIITTVEGLNLANPDINANDSKAELEKLAQQSISALLAFGIYESFEDPNNDLKISYAFDPTESGNQLGIKTESLSGSGQTEFTTGKRTSWLTPHLALIVSSDSKTTVTIKSDHIEAVLLVGDVYKYYFKNGVIVKLEVQINGAEKPFSGTIEYVTDKRVKDLVAAVN